MIGYYHFRNGTHAHCITSDDFEILVFRRSFESRSLSTHVNTFHHTDVVSFGNGFGFGDKFLVVGLAHIRETDAKFLVIFTMKRMFRKNINMIGNNHQITNFEIGIHTTRSIRNHQIFDSQCFHYAHRKRNLLHVISFIEVKSSLHGQYIYLAEFAENEFSAVSFHRRYRKIGDGFVWNFQFICYLRH